MTSTRERGASELVRGLGLWSATAVVIGNIIGTAIFLVGSEVARDARSTGVSVAVWIVGGLLSLCGALCLAELGAAMPRAGGMYTYLTRGLGPAWGFLYGWSSSTVIETAANAGVAAGFVRLVGFLLPAVGTPLFVLHIPGPFHSKTYEFAFTTAQPLAAAVIVLLTAVNYLSVRSGGRIQLLATSLKVGAVVTLVALGFVLQRGNLANVLPSSTPIPAGTAGAFLAALVPVMWAYNGWHLLGAAGEEVENPGRNIPRALCLRNAGRWRALRSGELGLPPRVGLQRRCAIFSCRFGRVPAARRQRERQVADHRDDDFCSRVFAHLHSHHRAHPVRHGPRWRVFRIREKSAAYFSLTERRPSFHGRRVCSAGFIRNL
jgi:amino acid transporter